MRTRAWICPRSGGPEALHRIEEDLPHLRPTDVLVKHAAIGLNFVDVYHRSGLYPNPTGRLGTEAAGVIGGLGEAVEDFQLGDRVAYAAGPIGSYAEARVIDASHLLKIPEGISFVAAAGFLLKGMTAGMLVTRVFPMRANNKVLVHAAAGGVGSLVGQWLRAIGASPIGVVGSPRKKEQALRNGYRHVIDSKEADVLAEVMSLCAGDGVDVVLDGIGKDTLETSLQCLTTRGTLVSFGAVSGAVPAFPLSRLAPKALYVTRPTLTAYTRTRSELLSLAGDAFALLRSGTLRVSVNTYGFDDIPLAHRDLEQRRTTGSLVIQL